MADSSVTDKQTRSRAPEFLADLFDHTKDILVRGGITSDRAEEIATEVCSNMLLTWGGQQIYFPRGLHVRVSERDLKLYDDFNGTNHNELASKYNVSVQWVYKVVERMRLFDIERRQNTLKFG